MTVSAENGPILPGDFLTSSSMPGYAMKATGPGPVIGQALEGFGGSEVGFVMMLVKNGHYDGAPLPDGITADAPASAVTTDAVEITGDGTEAPTTVTIDTLETLTVTGALTVQGDAAFLGSVAVDGTLTAGDIASPAIDAIRSSIETVSGSTSANTDEIAALIERIGALEAADGEPATEPTTLDLSLVDHGLTVNGTLVVQDGLVVDRIGSLGDLLVLSGDVEFVGRPTFNNDTAGFADVAFGDRTVKVAFDRPFKDAPVVNATLTLALSEDGSQVATEQVVLSNGIAFIVSGASADGFSIILNKPAPADLRFSWTAFAVRDAKTFKSESAPVIEYFEPILPPAPAPEEEPVPAEEEPAIEETPAEEPAVEEPVVTEEEPVVEEAPAEELAPVVEEPAPAPEQPATEEAPA